MNIKTEFASNQTVLLVMPSAEYNGAIVDVIKQLSGNICYVTANKTYDALKESFQKNNVDIGNIVFIDTISKTMKKVPNQGEDVYYVSSPGALTELSLVIKNFLKKDFDYLIFDSITNLSIYQGKNTCARFLGDLVEKIKGTKTKAVFYALDTKEQGWIVDHAGTIVDKVIRVADSDKVVAPKGVPPARGASAKADKVGKNNSR